MANFKLELDIVRNRIASVEAELAREVQTINSEASTRIMAAVRKAEKSTAPLRSILYAIESSLPGSSDLADDAVSMSVPIAEQLLETEGSATVAQVDEEPSPPADAHLGYSDGEQTAAVSPLKDRGADLEMGLGEAQGSNPPYKITKASTRANKRSRPKVEGIKDPQSARHLILAILHREAKPVPFPALDHAVMDAGMTRSAGEKSRRTMLRAGLVKRIGNSLEINETGKQVLRQF